MKLCLLNWREAEPVEPSGEGIPASNSNLPVKLHGAESPLLDHIPLYDTVSSPGAAHQKALKNNPKGTKYPTIRYLPKTIITIPNMETPNTR